MAAQYQYGESHDVPAQAATFLQHLLAQPPFESGTKRTAFVSVLTFLNANGYATTAKDADAAQIVVDVAGGSVTAQDAIARLAAPAETPLPASLTLRQLITHECNLHVEALQILTQGD
jgi:prophage maintenance system killer protein